MTATVQGPDSLGIGRGAGGRVIADMGKLLIMPVPVGFAGLISTMVFRGFLKDIAQDSQVSCRTQLLVRTLVRTCLRTGWDMHESWRTEWTIDVTNRILDDNIGQIREKIR